MDELTEVEAPDGAVARGQGCLVGFHAALAELAALFGMADQRLNARSAIDKSRVGLHGQIPPDLVVKSQAIDIIKLIL
jgi:hypothetical protein